MLTIIKLKDLFSRLTAKSMERTLASWAEHAGFHAQAGEPTIHVVSGVAEAAESLGGPHVVVEAKVLRGEEPSGAVHFLFPARLVLEAISSLAMIPETEREAKAQEPLTEDELQLFLDLALGLCEGTNEVFQHLGQEVRLSPVKDDVRIRSGDDETILLAGVPDAQLTCITLEIDTGHRQFPVHEILSLDVAKGLADDFYASQT